MIVQEDTVRDAVARSEEMTTQNGLLTINFYNCDMHDIVRESMEYNCNCIAIVYEMPALVCTDCIYEEYHPESDVYVVCNAKRHKIREYPDDELFDLNSAVTPTQ